MSGAARLRQVWRESGLTGTARRWLGRSLAGVGRSLDRLARDITSPADPRKVATPETLALLAPNAALKDKYKGRRCFVLATGPSTLAQDLTRLRGEAVLAANEMFLRLQREKIPALALVVSDAAYFSDTPGYRRFVHDLDAAAADLGSLVMVPAAQRAELARRGCLAGGNVRYMVQVGRLMDYRSAAAVPELDFAAPVPGQYTVVQTCIAWALYMGFSEVHVLGVDLDFIAAPRQPIRHGYGASPYNDHDSISVQEAYRRDSSWDYPTMLRQVADQLDAFRRLDDIARARGQRVTNANSGGLLEVLERRPFDTLFA